MRQRDALGLKQTQGKDDETARGRDGEARRKGPPSFATKTIHKYRFVHISVNTERMERVPISGIRPSMWETAVVLPTKTIRRQNLGEGGEGTLHT